MYSISKNIFLRLATTMPLASHTHITSCNQHPSCISNWISKASEEIFKGKTITNKKFAMQTQRMLISILSSLFENLNQFSQYHLVDVHQTAQIVSLIKLNSQWIRSLGRSVDIPYCRSSKCHVGKCIKPIFEMRLIQLNLRCNIFRHVYYRHSTR